MSRRPLNLALAVWNWEERARRAMWMKLLEKCVDLYPEAVVLLEEQYRMHEDIMRFSSQEFYGDRLKAATAVAQSQTSQRRRAHRSSTMPAIVS